MISVTNGYRVPVSAAGKEEHQKGIFSRLNEVQDQLTGTEGYRLEVTPHKIVVRANEPAGIFYGMQTPMQLLPPEIGNKRIVTKPSWEIHCVRSEEHTSELQSLMRISYAVFYLKKTKTIYNKKNTQ